MAIRASESSSGYVKVGERPSRSRIVLQVNNGAPATRTLRN